MNQFKLGNYFTYDDLALFLESFEIGPANPKYNFIEVPGGSPIDLSESLIGDLEYKQRIIKAKFNMISHRSEWGPLMNLVRSRFHGKKLNVVPPDEDNYYFTGRVSVGPLVKEKASASFDIEIICDAYKLKNDVTSSNYTIPAAGTLAVNLDNDRKHVIPTFTVDAETQIVFGELSTTVSAGEHTITSLLLIEGQNSITFNAVEGTSITVSYQEGAL